MATTVKTQGELDALAASRCDENGNCGIVGTKERYGDADTILTFTFADGSTIEIKYPSDYVPGDPSARIETIGSGLKEPTGKSDVTRPKPGDPRKRIIAKPGGGTQEITEVYSEAGQWERDTSIPPVDVDPAAAKTTPTRTAAQEAASAASAVSSLASATASQAAAAASSATARYRDIQSKIAAEQSPAELTKLQAQADKILAELGQVGIYKVGKSLVRFDSKTGQQEVIYTEPASLSQEAYSASIKAQTEKGKQGLAYGLEDQIAAIRKAREQVFGPGGSGDPAEADKFLQDYVNSTLGGTTVSGAFESDRAAETSRITQRVTQRGQQASERQGAFGNFAETARYAPKGTNVGAAFESFMASQPKAVDVPQAPSFLEAYRQKTGAPAKTAAVSTPSVATPATVSGGITINIGGGGATGTTTETVGAAETPALGKTEGASEYSPEVIELLAKMNAIPSGPSGSYIPQYTSGQKAVEVPEALRGKNLATPDDVMALWKDDFAV